MTTNAPTIADLTNDIVARNALTALITDADPLYFDVDTNLCAALDALLDRAPFLAIDFLHRAGTLPPFAARAYAILYLAGYRATR